MGKSVIRAFVPRSLIAVLCIVAQAPLATRAVAQHTDSVVVSQHRDGKGPYWTGTSGTPISGKAKKTLKNGTVTALSSLSSSADLVVDSLNMTGVGTDASICATGCFAVTAEQSTVPYFSLDKPRNITLRYNSGIAAPRPVAFVDVHINPSSTKTLKEYWLQVQRNGANVTFLNGDTKLRFAAPSTQSTGVRLAGQFDNRFATNNMDSVTYVVTAVWNDNSTQVMSFNAWFLNMSAVWWTSVGRGWYIAGIQTLFTHGSGRLFLFNGDGSASMFSPLGSGAYQTETNGDFSIVKSAGSGSNLVYTRTYPDSSRVQFDYLGREIRSISTTYDTVKFAYDGGSWRLQKVYDPYRTYNSGANQAYIGLHYAVSGLLSWIGEPGADGTPDGGRITNVTISSDSLLTAIQDPDGVSTTYSYNSDKLLTAIINRRGDTTRFVYNPQAWLLEGVVAPQVPIDYGGGATTTYSPVTEYRGWQNIGVPTSSTTTTAATAALWTDIKGRVRDPLLRMTTYTVDLDGRALGITAPLSQTTTIARDGSWTGLPYRVTYPTSGSDTLQFTANTPNLTYTQPAGDSAYNYHYGVNGQMDSTWALGQLALKNFLNSTSALSDSTRSGSSDSLVTRNTYDSYRRLLTTRDVSGHLTTYHYDPVFGNLDSTTVAGATYTKKQFDGFGRDTAHVTKGAMYWSRTQYDTLNRVVKTWHRGFTGDTTTTTYDALFVTRVKIPGGTIYKTDVDALGRVTKRYDGVDTTKYTSYRYDPTGRLTSSTNRRGQLTYTVYDSLNRPVLKGGTNVVPDTFYYSANNRIQTVIHGSVSRDSTFLNVNGQVDSVVHRFGGRRYAVLSTYSKFTNGKRTSRTITSDAGINWVQESEAFLAGATSIDSVTLTPGAGSGSMVRTLNRDNVPTMVQWPSGTPTKSTSYSSLIQPYAFNFGGSGAINDSLSRDYQRDTLGRISIEWRKTGSGYESRKYVYDGLGRLLKVQRANLSGCTRTTDSIVGAVYSCTTANPLTTQDSVGYDVAGNKTLSGATYSSTGNRLLTWPGALGTITYTYDADGNVATRNYNGVTDSLFWDANNQLDSIRTGGGALRYKYNSDGYPVVRNVAGIGDRIWVWDNNQLIAELDSTGTNRRAQYLYSSLDQPYAIVTDSGGAPLVRYFQQDQLENVTGVMRGNALAQFTRYNAWGQIEAQPVNTPADTSRLGWKGLVYDGDANRQIYFMRNRWYDPAVGRFVSEDPIGLAGGSNLYRFTTNDPINYSDPTGLASYVNCRPLEYSDRFGHCGIRVIDSKRGYDVTVELIPVPTWSYSYYGSSYFLRKEIYWSSVYGNSKTAAYVGHPWVRIAIPSGMSEQQFDNAILNRALFETIEQRGYPYYPFGQTNSNRFIYNVITKAGGRVPAGVSEGFQYGTPGLCGGDWFYTGDDCY